MGPTASGKTDVAAKISDHFDCELVSVDAAQVYRHMNIGTAKPDKKFLDVYPHHLVDIRDINQPYSAAEFCSAATKLIDEIHQRGKIPIFVGGTMFYFSALENGLSNLPSANQEIRDKLDSEISENGLAALHQQLSEVDPQSARKIKSTDAQRIQRAMEIYHLTGIAPSELMSQSSTSNLANPILKISLFTENRAQLHVQIENRFKLMLDSGLENEVTDIASKLENPEELPAMRTVGYRQVLDYINGKITEKQMVENGIAATRQLAKRQLTWLRNQSGVTWFGTNHPKCAESMLKFLESHSIMNI